MTGNAKSENLNAISGKNYLAIQVAVEELRKRNLHVDGYKIKVLRMGDSILVIFLDENQPDDAIGSVGPKPGIEVEIDPSVMQVIRSDFIR